MVKILSRDAINRMVGRKSSVAGVGGGGGDVDLSGYATKIWTQETFVSIDFFRSLFRAYDSQNHEILPNDTETTIDNIKAMFGFWTEQYLSALGQGSSGGGGIVLAEPLQSINSAGLGTPQSANVGLVWNGTAWTYDAIGGGGGSGDVTWTALAASSNEQINFTHLSTALSGYALTSQIPTNNNQLTNGAGYITSSALSSYLPLSGGTLTGVLTTNTYVNVKNFIYFRNYNDDNIAGYVGRGGGSINDIMLVGINNYISLSGLGVKLGCSLINSEGTIYYINFDGSSFVGYGQGNTGNTNIYGGNILFCNYSGSSTRMFINTSSGNIGIGTNSPSYTLHVAGSIYATGGVTALSDARHKTIINPTDLQVEQIAKMPAVVYRWNDGRDDNSLHVGSIAQDWQRILPEVVLKANDKEGTLSMQYGVAALVSSIITARKVVDHERRIAELERENKELKMKLKIA